MRTLLRLSPLPVAAALLLGGCMVAKQPAPIVERSPEPARPAGVKPKPGAAPVTAQAAPAARAAADDLRPETYTVKRGDTLYGIALDHGQDYRDIARWNNLTDPNLIEVGQVLRVRDPASARLATPETTQPGSAGTTPYQAAPMAEGKEVGPQSAQPLPEQKRPATAVADAPADSGVIMSPRPVKLPYSEAALAKLRAAAAEGAAKPAPPAVAVAEAPAAKETAAPAKVEPPPASADDPDGIAWSWPTKGTVVANFSDGGGTKGLQIAGEMGQPVLASAGGRVVYTGSGLRGYGNLVIIKHNNTYLSAYAHNRAVLVKQGDNVAKGQKIAEMGNSDASRVMLHFEIRRLGKPVDPARFLPPA